MSQIRESAEHGHYARKQLFSRDRLVAWSHRRRFETGLSLAAAFAGKRLLDFGCGDGTFLGLTMASPHAPALGVGAEPHAGQVADCQRRYQGEPRLRFVSVDALRGGEHHGQYDGVFCMEVLEHVVNWEPELDLLGRMLAPDGRLVISVPVETGPPLVIKQIARRIAGWRKIGHYPGTTSYSMRELALSLLAGDAQHVTRPVFDTGTGPFHDHKGFNWRVLRERLGKQFVIERCVASPFSSLGPLAATQVWFVARRSPSAAK
jgi:2-polyprenyl-3-methyl-5-hydroxy-6-metoxy-1,4-benzoquinol methylase